MGKIVKYLKFVLFQPFLNNWKWVKGAIHKELYKLMVNSIGLVLKIKTQNTESCII